METEQTVTKHNRSHLSYTCITKCGSKANYSPKALMSFSNFARAISRTLMEFSFSNYVSRKEFGLVSNVKFDQNLSLCLNAISGYIWSTEAIHSVKSFVFFFTSTIS